MSRNPKRGLLRLILAFYCIYAISPVYLSAIGGREHTAAWGASERNVTMGIVWVNVLLSSLTEVHGTGTPVPASVQADETGREFILIKKKRALLNETYRVRPLLESQAVVTAFTGSPEPRLLAFDGSRGPQVRHSDQPLSTHLGLSPPHLSA